MNGASAVLSLGAVKGAISGLVGAGATVGFTLLAQQVSGHMALDEDQMYTLAMFVGLISYWIGLGIFRYWFDWARGNRPSGESKPPQGWKRYFNVDFNHKVIGIQYATTGLIFLPFAVALQLAGRVQMVDPALHLLSLDAYDSLISGHGIVMLFIVVLPVFSGLMNYLVPLQIGSRDVAFPHLNAFTFWLIPPAGLMAAFSLAAGGFDTGWTVYPPLSTAFEKTGMDLILLGVTLSGLSSILTAVNIITTVVKMRAPGMTYFRMPIFLWATMATVGLTLIFTQFVAVAFLMVLFQRIFGMAFFNPEMGGQPLLYQYLFWFYSHPAVYVFVLLGLGIISDIIPPFVRKPLFGYKGVAISGPLIALGGTVVFAHHMFAAGMPGFLRVPFMITTLLVAVPTGVKVFAWVATTWMGKMRLDTPLLFVFSSVVLFLVGGLTGMPLGIVPADLYLHDTYWVVGHFHAMFFGGFLMPVMAAIYFWFPKASGRMLSERLGKVNWLLMTLGITLMAIPMLGLGLLGMRRRIADYAFGAGFQELHVAIGIGGFLVFAGLVILAYNIVTNLSNGSLAGNNPWNTRTLEWMISSPPPENNFEELPEVLDRPHLYGVPGSLHARLHPSPGDAGGSNLQEESGR